VRTIPIKVEGERLFIAAAAEAKADRAA